MMKWTREYGCTQCQTWHIEIVEPDLFAEHLSFQSKQGYRTRPCTEREETYAVGLGI